jgi:hypothetical protein
MGRGWDGMIGLGMVVQVQLVEILQMSFDWNLENKIQLF